MRQCKDCNLILEDDVRYCPNCGRSVDDEASCDEPDLRLATLLTSASLHKLKREWDAAIADATQALELDPNNADVASLLAGIYEQKNNPDEAAVWYRIALDLDPRNKATRARLDRVAAGGTFPRRIPWLPYAIAAGATVVLVVLTVVLTLAIARPRAKMTHRDRVAETRAASAPAIRSPATGSGTTSEPPLAGPVEGGKATEQATSQTGTGRTSGESAVRGRIAQSDRSRAAGVSVDDLVSDPRQGIVTVTFSLPANTPVTKSRVLAAAGQVARDAFSATTEAKFVTARCMIAPGGPSTAQIAFVGDMARASFESLPESPTEAQLDEAFAGKWWNPQVR